MLERILRPLAVIAVAIVAFGACSSDGSTAKSSTTTAPAAEPLHILLTNDDGYAAAGIDTVATALAALPDVRLTIVAPATNQSGTGGKTTAGEVRATNDKRRTASGRPATAVIGYPADAVNYAFDHMGLTPDVVVSGINEGQNLGPVAAISGTVGAAKRAAALGVPAIAVSQGVGTDMQYDVGATLTVAWIRDHRAQLIEHRAAVGVVNVNVPTCATGALRGVRQVPLATTLDDAVAAADCASTVTAVRTDVEAFHNGYAAVTQLTADGATSTSSTTFPATKPSTSAATETTTST
jgi:5'-nucleotidase